jgi:hypothetical protein
MCHLPLLSGISLKDFLTSAARPIRFVAFRFFGPGSHQIP